MISLNDDSENGVQDMGIGDIGVITQDDARNYNV